MRSALAFPSSLAAALLAAAPTVFARTATPPPPAAPGTQPVTHEALWLMKRVGAPAVSPDGRWAVFPVTEPAYDEKKEVQDLWIVPVDGSAPARRLTGGRAGESSPAWSPDGRRVAFTAKRDDDDVAQVYVLDVAGGGEARRVSSSPLAARAPRWSPDGKWIAYQSAVYEGAPDVESNRKLAAERKEAKSKLRAYETFPVRRWDKWLDETDTHVFTVAADGAVPARDLLAGTRLAAERGFGGAGGEGGGDDLRPEWSPDGRSLVIVASTNRTDAAHSPTNTHLYQVPLGGGEPVRLTSGHASHDSPRFSPDGRALCYRVSDEWGRIYALHRLACAPWPWTGGAATVVTAGFDRSVADFSFAPDSRTVYLTAEDAGFVRLYAASLAGGSVAPVLDTRGAFGAIESPEGTARPLIVASWGSATEPAEIVRVDPEAGTKTRLTEFDVAAAAALAWTPLEEFSFTNARGRRVHSFLVKPPAFDPARKYPLLVLIHGGHASMWRDSITLRWNYHLLASPGYVVLLTDYRGSTGYGEAFTLDILGDPLRGPADDVNRAADEAIRRYPFVDASRQAAGGASYGGHLANWLEATTTRYRCLVSHAGLASLASQWATSDSIHHRELMMGAPFWERPDAWRDQSPVSYAKSFRTPMLLSVGENDYRVPVNNTLEMYAVLSRMKVPARLLVWPDENHWIQKGENGRAFYREVHDWLARWLR
jgi:dipeptidyl aminopeptidase/acylaminoacyl peptidase